VEYDSRYIRSHDFVGMVADAGEAEIAVDVRNRIRLGDHLEVIGPGMVTHSITLERMSDSDGHLLDTAHPNSRILLEVPFPAARYDLVRRERYQEMHTPLAARPDAGVAISAVPEVL
jgi:putative protease